MGSSPESTRRVKDIRESPNQWARHFLEFLVMRNKPVEELRHYQVFYIALALVN